MRGQRGDAGQDRGGQRGPDGGGLHRAGHVDDQHQPPVVGPARPGPEDRTLGHDQGSAVGPRTGTGQVGPDRPVQVEPPAGAAAGPRQGQTGQRGAQGAGQLPRQLVHQPLHQRAQRGQPRLGQAARVLQHRAQQFDGGADGVRVHRRQDVRAAVGDRRREHLLADARPEQGRQLLRPLADPGVRGLPAAAFAAGQAGAGALAPTGAVQLVQREGQPGRPPARLRPAAGPAEHQPPAVGGPQGGRGSGRGIGGDGQGTSGRREFGHGGGLGQQPPGGERLTRRQVGPGPGGERGAGTPVATRHRTHRS